MSEPVTFVCPRCTMESWNPNDLHYGYCGNCKRFTRDEEDWWYRTYGDDTPVNWAWIDDTFYNLKEPIDYRTENEPVKKRTHDIFWLGVVLRALWSATFVLVLMGWTLFGWEFFAGVVSALIFAVTSLIVGYAKSKGINMFAYRHSQINKERELARKEKGT